MRHKVFLLMLGLLLLSAPACLPAEYTWEEEVKVGKEAAAEIEKAFGVLNLKDELLRLHKIVSALVPQTPKPGIEYEVKILNLTDPNAFSIPGGHLYVTIGFLKFVQSDHELAGVLAHELAHSVHQHALNLMEKSKKVTLKTTFGTLLTLLLLNQADVKGDVGALIPTAQAILINAMSGYTRKAEEEADKSAIQYLKNSAYNPVGLLTFLERLLREEEKRPWLPEPGIYKTHPSPRDRVKYIVRTLKNLDIPINRKEVIKVSRVEVREVLTENKRYFELFIGNETLMKLSAPEDGLGPFERAQEYALRLNEALDANVGIRDLQIDEAKTVVNIVVQKKRLVTVFPEDAEENQASMKSLAEHILSVMRREILENMLERIY